MNVVKQKTWVSSLFILMEQRVYILKVRYFVISIWFIFFCCESSISCLTQTLTKTFKNYFCTDLNLNLSKFLPLRTLRALHVQPP